MAASAAAVFATLSMVPATPAQQPAETKSETPHFALMIGIDDYPGSPLDGCRNDIEDMKQLLVSKFGYTDDPGHIKTLFDAEATRANIISAFKEHLIANAKKYPNGTFLLEYSGHGDHIADNDGEEEDGEDETLVPYDSIMDASKDIRDDELETLFKELAKYTDNITFIIDSCHSGTNVRAIGQAKVRQVPAEIHKDRIKSLPAPTVKSNPKARGTGGAISAMPNNKKYIALSGCDSDETSAETYQNDRSNGLMTRSLINILSQDSGTPRTYQDVWREYRDLVTEENPRQHPQLEGDVNRLFLQDALHRSAPPILVESKDGRIAMSAGSAQGIKKSALVAIYSKKATKLEGEKDLLTQAKVVSVTATSAVLEPTNTAISSEELNGAKAVLISPPFEKQIVVGVDSSIPNADELIAKLSSASDSKFFSFKKVTDALKRRSADVSIVPMSYSEFEKLRDNRIKAMRSRGIDNDTAGFVLLSRSGDPLFDKFVVSSTLDDTAGSVQVQLYKRLRQESLRALTNEQSALKNCLEIKLYTVTLEDDDRTIAKRTLVSSNTSETPVIEEGQRIQFEIKNKAKIPVYTTIIDLGTSGGVLVAYPPAQAKVVLPPQKSFVTPAIKLSAPYGQEMFKFYATSKYTDFDFLNSQGVVRGVRATKPEESKLRDMVLKATTGDNPDEIPSIDEWSTTDLSVSVVPPRKSTEG